MAMIGSCWNERGLGMLRGKVLGAAMACLLPALVAAVQATAQTADLPSDIAARSYEPHALVRILGQSTRELKPVERQPNRSSSRTSFSSHAGNLRAFQDLIERYSSLHSLDPDLVRAVIVAESSGNPRALSTRGAWGLMQLVPATAAQMGTTKLFDPEQRIASGTGYLRVLLDRFEKVEVALWAYHDGPTAVENGRLTSETGRYVTRVLQLRRNFKKTNVE